MTTESIDDHGATGDGETLDTEEIQAAIDACADAGGGTVRVPAGTYRTGTVFLRSHTTLRLDAGATLYGSADRADYGSSRSSRTALIVADDCESVSVVGGGTIHGNGTAFMEMDTVLDPADDPAIEGGAYLPRQDEPDTFLRPDDGVGDGPVAPKEWRPGRLLLCYDCEDVRVEGVTFRNAPTWTVHFLGCDGVTVRGVDVRNEIRIPNSDGINPHNSRNVTISDCYVYTGDDAISPKTTTGTGVDGPCENVTVTNCVLTSRSCAVKLGSESALDMRDHTYSNIVVRDSNRALGIQHREAGDIENVLFSDVTVETRLHTGNWWGQAEPITVTSLPKRSGESLGTVRDVRFRNVVARGEGGAVLWGTDGSIEAVTFDDVSVHLRDSDLAGVRGGNVDLRPTNVRPSIAAHDVPGVLARDVDDLTLRAVRVTWPDDPPDYYASAVACDGCDGVTVDGFRGRGASDVAVSVGECRRVTVRDSRADEGTGTFLSIRDSDGRLFTGNDLTDARRGIAGDAGFVRSGNRE